MTCAENFFTKNVQDAFILLYDKLVGNSEPSVTITCSCKMKVINARFILQWSLVSPTQKMHAILREKFLYNCHVDLNPSILFMHIVYAYKLHNLSNHLPRQWKLCPRHCIQQFQCPHLIHIRCLSL